MNSVFSILLASISILSIIILVITIILFVYFKQQPPKIIERKFIHKTIKRYVRQPVIQRPQHQNETVGEAVTIPKYIKIPTHTGYQKIYNPARCPPGKLC